MVPEPQPLFARLDLRDYLRNRRAAMKQEIQPLDLTALTANEPALRQYLEHKYQIQPLQLGTDIEIVECTDTFLNLRGTAEGALWGNPSRVPGRRIVFAIPFQGHHELFHCTPSTRCGTARMFIVTETELRAVICAPTNKDAVEIRRQLDRELDYVRKHIAWMADDLQRYAAATPSYIERCIADRKKEFADKAAAIAAFGIKVRAPLEAQRRSTEASREGGRPQTEDRAVTPAKADAQNGRALLLQRPPSDLSPQTSALGSPSSVPSPPSTFPPCSPSDVGSSKLEVQCSPSASSSDFTRILHRILRSARLIERTPKSWRDWDENTLRDLVMTVISADYPIINGEANTGDGRSDILIQDHEGRTLFIGECKKWKGRESLVSGVKQLLSYANWRDRHLALIIFVAAGSIAEIPRMIARVFPESPFYRCPLAGPQEDGIYRYLFSWPDDPRCEVQIAVVLIHVHRASAV